MRVIGTSKRWWGQKGTQPHPENLIGESLEAQHSKGESLLNYIYIHTCIHKPSVILALLASSLYFESCSSSLETATETSSIQTSLYSPTPTFSHHLTFFPPSISSFWPLSASRFNIFMVQFYFKLHKLFFPFHFLWTFRYKSPPSIGVSLVETSFRKSLVKLQHCTFNKHFQSHRSLRLLK